VSRTAASPRRNAQFDVVGQISAIVALGSVGYAVIEGGNHGWGSPLILALFAATLAAGIVFLAAQARGRHPMVPLAMFGSRQLSVALVIAFTSMAAFYGVVFVQTSISSSSAAPRRS
jgi:MFS transporter, DHA2 family, methylenomycin A resistance protein